jgi:surface carbohydrate biosynthesis protein
MFFSKSTFSKTYSFWQSYLKPKKTWFFPSSSDIIIVDESGSESIFPFLENLKVTIIYTRGEKVNIPCLVYAVILRIFKFDCFYISYVGAYIKLTSPKVLITFIDNNPSFYKLSLNFPKIQTVFIQNGFRCSHNDIFETLSYSKKQHVDFMLVFGKTIGELYSKYISGKVIPIGSLKNNSILRGDNYLDAKDKNKVVFISQWRNKPTIGFFLPSYNIEYDLFYKAEKEVLNFLSKWCLANICKLEICGCSELEGKNEHAYFKKLLPNFSFEFSKKESNISSYSCIDKAEIVVFIDSTLGYESLSRGNKTAALTIRSEILGWDDYSFGWPKKFPNYGLFWTNELDIIRFGNIMNYLKNVSDKEWKSVVNEVMTDIIEYDPGNMRIKELINQIFPKQSN